jgi:hypothetical protein
VDLQGISIQSSRVTLPCNSKEIDKILDRDEKLLTLALQMVSEERNNQHRARSQPAQLHNSRQPFNQLPAELLSYIFVLSLPTGRCSDPARKRIIQTNMIAATCSWWRAFVLNDPHLWGCVVLGRHTPPAAIRAWIKRSQGMSLTIDVSLRGRLEPRKWNALRGIFLAACRLCYT